MTDQEFELQTESEEKIIRKKVKEYLKNDAIDYFENHRFRILFISTFFFGIVTYFILLLINKYNNAEISLPMYIFGLIVICISYSAYALSIIIKKIREKVIKEMTQNKKEIIEE